MNRNIYHRIEVCFPIVDKSFKAEILAITAIQLADNCQAVIIDQELNNMARDSGDHPRQSQKEIYELLLRNT